MIPRRPVAALLFVASLLGAGCLAGSGRGPAPTTSPALAFDHDWAEKALPFGAGHDHFNPKQHQNLSTPNFQELGWDPLIVKSKGTTAGGYFCGEAHTRADGRRLAVVNSFYSGVAFVLADVTDPAHPFEVGEFSVGAKEMVYDVAMTPDALHVVVGVDPDTTLPPIPGRSLVAPMTFTDACRGETMPLPGIPPPNGPSVLMVGISDPAHPVLEDSVPQPVLGPHSVSTSLIDGVTYVAVSVTNLQHQGSYYTFFTESNGKLTPKWAYQAKPPQDGNVPVINGHVDATVAKHPVTGGLVAYLADWDAGVVILDLSGPVPKELSSFSKYTGGGGSYQTGVETGNLHDAVPIDGLWDGRHYVLAGQEILAHPADHPSGWVYILDDTDPTQLREVGRWVLPVDVQWSADLQFSTHYISLIGRTAFISMYHGGVWAFDVSTPESLKQPPSIGAFIPAHESPKPIKVGGGDVVGTPTVMETSPLPDGSLVLWDAQSGIYVVKFDASQPAPAQIWKGV